MAEIIEQASMKLKRFVQYGKGRDKTKRR